MTARVEVGSAGHATAYADGAAGRAATFDWGDGSAPDIDIVNADPSQSPVSTHVYTANGTFPVTVSSGGVSDTADAVITDLADEEAPEEFDPAAHTVAEVQAYAADLPPDQVEALLLAEENGKNRTTLVTALEAML